LYPKQKKSMTHGEILALTNKFVPWDHSLPWHIAMRPRSREPTGEARPPRTEHPHGARAAVTCRSVRSPLLLVLVLLVAGTPLLDAHDYVDDASFPLFETHVPLWSGDEAPRPFPPVRPGLLSPH